jgi:hypothetical protein
MKNLWVKFSLRVLRIVSVAAAIGAAAPGIAGRRPGSGSRRSTGTSLWGFACPLFPSSERGNDRGLGAGGLAPVEIFLDF